MGNNPYSAINAIYKLKGLWNTANNAGDTATKNSVAAKAQEYYKQLRNNGYGDIADQLTASNYTQAKAINDKWAKMGKTSTRDYMYSLGQSRGMSQSDIDELINWDNLTGEVSFGGEKIGTPDAVVDGVSYWSDTSVLDNAFNDYIDRSGTVRNRSTAIDQENEKLFAKYNQEYEDLKNTNPFETETGKAILAKYDLAGLQGRNNAVASNAGSNGGNIDSFAAANALRQQASLINQGQMVALEAHQQKLDHARALLSDMGVNIDRVFNQDETAKNNQVSRDVATSEVTGVVPTSMLYQMPYYSQFFNTDGTLKNPDIDYKAEIEKAEAVGNTELAKVLRAARGVKIFSDYGKYGQYADGDYTVPGTKITESARQFNEQVAAAAKYGKTTTSSGSVTTAKPTLTASQAATAIKNGEISQTVIDAYNHHYGTSYTVTNPPKLSSGSNSGVIDLLTDGSNNSGATTLTDAQVKAWADKLNKALSDKYGSEFKAVESTGNGKYKSVPTSAEYTVMRVLESDELTDAQKQYLLIDKFGISPDTINNMLKDPHYK